MTYKHLPNAKTLLLEFKLVVADLFHRNTVLTESVPHRTENIKNGDASVSSLKPEFDLGKVENFILIHCYQGVEIRTTTTDASGAPVVQSIRCKGVFAVSSAYDNVTVAYSGADSRFYYSMG